MYAFVLESLWATLLLIVCLKFSFLLHCVQRCLASLGWLPKKTWSFRRASQACISDRRAFYDQQPTNRRMIVTVVAVVVGTFTYVLLPVIIISLTRALTAHSVKMMRPTWCRQMWCTKVYDWVIVGNAVIEAQGNLYVNFIHNNRYKMALTFSLSAEHSLLQIFARHSQCKNKRR
jgi:hypothetical protein